MSVFCSSFSLCFDHVDNVLLWQFLSTSISLVWHIFVNNKLPKYIYFVYSKQHDLFHFKHKNVKFELEMRWVFTKIVKEIDTNC